MKVTLHILASDILSTDFFNPSDCAITRALKRAGIDGRHTGFHISFTNEYHKLTDGEMKGCNKIWHMYEGRIQPRDFSSDLDLPEELVKTNPFPNN